MKHRSVLLEEVLSALEPANGSTIVDATLGAGGHAKAILDRFSGDTKIIGFDKDPEAITEAEKVLQSFEGRVMMINDDYKNIAGRLKEIQPGPIRGTLLDLGVSSMQLDEAGRGFSFRHDGPLDMRMNPKSSLTAEHIVNAYPKDVLLEILWKFGEERFARKIVDRILQFRVRNRISSTLELAELVKSAVPSSYRHGRIHPATRTFQALRIAVNDEQNSLREFFSHALDYLASGGRIVIISFHSLEDRMAKQTFRDYQRNNLGKVITKRPVIASKEEERENPRSRSAKLRIFEKF